MVRMKGLEPSRLAAHAPKACVSTNSTTSAHLGYYSKFTLYRKVVKMLAFWYGGGVI